MAQSWRNPTTKISTSASIIPMVRSQEKQKDVRECNTTRGADKNRKYGCHQELDQLLM